MDTKDAGSLGGHARRRNLSDDEIAAIGRKGGEARAAKLKPAKRKGIARLGGLAKGKKTGDISPETVA